MQATHQIPRSDQKKMDEIKRIHKAMATCGSILTDIEKGVITENAKVLGMSGEYHIERLLAKLNEEGNEQPATMMRMISDYIARLEKQVAG
jgi:hypothetical protein